MTAPTLQIRDLTVRFGGHVAVDHVTCDFHAGELTAIVGPNGAGKTTCFNLISGQIPVSEGSVTLNGRDITQLSVAQRTHLGIGRAFQLTNLFPGLSVFENLRLVVQSRKRKGFELFTIATRHQDITEATEGLLRRVGLWDLSGQTVSELSHGNQRKLEVAMLIALDPKVYMFDEPTAGMSVDEAPVVLDLIAELKRDATRTILLVEHKMDVIRTLADRIIVLHNGALAADGAPAEVMASDVVQEAYMGKSLEDV